VVATKPASPVVFTAEDFAAAGIVRWSPLHTKSRLRKQWRLQEVETSTEFWQVAEDIFACEVTLNNTDVESTVALDVLLSLGSGGGQTAISGLYSDSDGSVAVCMDAGGPAVAARILEGGGLGVVSIVGHQFFSNISAARIGLQHDWGGGSSEWHGVANGPAFATLTFNLSVPARSSLASTFVIARAGTCADALALLRDDTDLAGAAEVQLLYIILTIIAVSARSLVLASEV
jgi:hypothetical protein